MKWLPFIGLMMTAAFCKGQSSSPSGVIPLLERDAIPWNDERVMAHLKEMSSQEHVMGSPRQQELAAYLQEQAKQIGLTVFVDSFKATVPDPAATSSSSVMQNTTLELPLTNVYAKLELAGSPCTIIVGSHYDSKRLPEGNSFGANDSGSSSAALLELMVSLQTMKSKLACSVLAVWFDGEEAYLSGWNDGETSHPSRIKDHLYGSRHMAGQLQRCKEGENSMCVPAAWGGESVKAMVLLDMIGMPQARLTADSNSDAKLLEWAKAIDQAYYEGRYYRSSRNFPVIDDHMPFRALSIPVIDLIDFENISTWHTQQDRYENISSSSIRDIGRLATALIVQIAPAN